MKKDEMKKSSLTLGVFLAVVTIIIWGITFVSTKHLSENFSALEILVARFLMAYFGLWIFCPHVLKLQERRHEINFALAGFFGITAYQFMENVALTCTYAANVSIIVSICPMFTAIISQIFNKEKNITPFFIVGFIFSMAGVSLVTLNGSTELHFSPKGDLLALGAAVCWGFYSLFVSRLNALGYTSMATTRRTFFWALVFMIPLVAFGLVKGGESTSVNFSIEGFRRYLNPISLLNLSFLGFGASAFCFFSWSRVCRIIGTVKASVGIYFIPVVTIIVSFLFLGEKLSLMGIFGAALTIAGLVISNKKGK